MVLLFCAIAFLVFTILGAMGEDWEASEHNASIRTQRIIDAISQSSRDVRTEIRESLYDQTDYLERFCQDTEKEEEFQDSHGRWFRKRLVYNEQGNVIAEEIVGVER